MPVPDSSYSRRYSREESSYSSAYSRSSSVGGRASSYLSYTGKATATLPPRPPLYEYSTRKYTSSDTLGTGSRFLSSSSRDYGGGFRSSLSPARASSTSIRRQLETTAPMMAERIRAMELKEQDKEDSLTPSVASRAARFSTSSTLRGRNSPAPSSSSGGATTNGRHESSPPSLRNGTSGGLRRKIGALSELEVNSPSSSSASSSSSKSAATTNTKKPSVNNTNATRGSRECEVDVENNSCQNSSSSSSSDHSPDASPAKAEKKAKSNGLLLLNGNSREEEEKNEEKEMTMKVEDDCSNNEGKSVGEGGTCDSSSPSGDVHVTVTLSLRRGSKMVEQVNSPPLVEEKDGNGNPLLVPMAENGEVGRVGSLSPVNVVLQEPRRRPFTSRFLKPKVETEEEGEGNNNGMGPHSSKYHGVQGYGSRDYGAPEVADNDSEPLSSSSPKHSGKFSGSRESSALDKAGLTGLRNIGNTCFMNTVLQCLSNTKPLLEYVLRDNYEQDINRSTSGMKGALIRAFGNLIHELWREQRAVDTSAFKDQIQRFAPRFMGYSQQDAQEFLRYLLEGLHEDVNRVTAKPTPITTDIDDSLSDAEKAAESWRRYLRYESSKIVDMFVGQFKSTLRCTVCGHCSVTFDPFWDLSIPIPSRGGSVRLSQCFELMTKEEVLDGDEKPTCAKCQCRRKCTKSLAIQKFPKILVVHLKRFSLAERYRGKLNTLVEYPLNGLDLNQFSTRGNVGSYNLYGVAIHSGSTYSGHYIAYCKQPYSGEWHCYNDSRVSSISPHSVVSSDGYVLFYEQIGQSSNL